MIRKGGYGDAPDGRAVRHKRNHRGSVSNARKLEERFPLLYDMLGEAALTAADAERMVSISAGDHAIGKASNGRASMKVRAFQLAVGATSAL